MVYAVALLALSATLAAAAPAPIAAAAPGPEPQTNANDGGTAILQFEIDNDTFTSNTRINIPGTVDFSGRNFNVLAAAVSTTQGVRNPDAVRCRALDARGRQIGPQFGVGNPKNLNDREKVRVFSIRCA